jgi:hypothetical protein
MSKFDPNALYVVETDKTAYLGRLVFTADSVKIHTGRTGNPPKVKVDEVEAIIPASKHPDVVFI